MIITVKPVSRAIGIGATAAALLIGSFLLGSARSGASSAAGSGAAGNAGAGRSGVVLTSSAAGGKITVTGTGTVTGTPDQLVLSMGVQTSASSVSTALQEANQAARGVIRALVASGVRTRDIQTSGLSIQPNYSSNGQSPAGYDVSEQLTATLNHLATAGSQIQAAVRAGGNATTVDGVSLNLTDNSKLLARARAAAIADAQAKASQFAHALGRPLGSVLSVSDQSPMPYPIFAAGVAAARPAASVPVQPGKQQVSVQVTVVYAIG